EMRFGFVNFIPLAMHVTQENVRVKQRFRTSRHVFPGELLAATKVVRTFAQSGLHQACETERHRSPNLKDQMFSLTIDRQRGEQRLFDYVRVAADGIESNLCLHDDCTLRDVVIE